MKLWAGALRNIGAVVVWLLVAATIGWFAFAAVNVVVPSEQELLGPCPGADPRVSGSDVASAYCELLEVGCYTAGDRQACRELQDYAEQRR
jgi:hypothetical protein